MCTLFIKLKVSVIHSTFTVAARLDNVPNNDIREITRFCKNQEATVTSSGPRMLVVAAFFQGNVGGIRLRAFGEEEQE